MDLIQNAHTFAEHQTAQAEGKPLISSDILNKGRINLVGQELIDRVNGTVHADPHPGNYMMDNQGKLWQIDFGRSMILDEKVAKNKRQLDIALFLGKSDTEIETALKAINAEAYNSLTPDYKQRLLTRLKEQPLASFDMLFVYGLLEHPENSGIQKSALQRSAELNVNNRLQAATALGKLSDNSSSVSADFLIDLAGQISKAYLQDDPNAASDPELQNAIVSHLIEYLRFESKAKQSLMVENGANQVRYAADQLPGVIGDLAKAGADFMTAAAKNQQQIPERTSEYYLR
jgi:hypothetical protein